MSIRRHALRLAAALLACAAVSPALADKKNNSVRFATAVTLNNIDPYFNSLAAGTMVADQIWDSLIYRDPDTGEYKGDLATGWRWVDDKTLELDLRRNVTFHNGAAFTADDVVYTLNFMTKPENKSLQQSLLRWIGRVEKLDTYRVRIVAKRVFPAALAYLATPKLAIYPHEYYAAVGPKGMSAKPIGTGPYRVVEHALGKYIRLERNPDYFQGGPKVQPKIDHVEIRFIPDPQTQVAESLAGGLDLIAAARDQAAQLKDVRGLQVVSSDSDGYSVLAINTRKETPAPQLRDLRVRQAIMYAIDRDALVKYVAGSRVLHTECHPIQFGCTDVDVRHYAYDPNRSRQLLAEAGFPKGFNVDLYTAGNRNEAEAIIGYLRAVGINARLRYLQLAAVISATHAGTVGLAFFGWSNSIADVSNAVSEFHEFSPNDINRDPEVRDLLIRGDTSFDPMARNAAYAAAFKLIADRAYVLPLHSLETNYLAAQGLVLTPHDDGTIRFYEMSWK